jgi:hypothetical protein
MAGPRRGWKIALGVFAVMNIGGGIYALVTGEVMHASAHAALLAVTLAFWPRGSAPAPATALEDVPQIDLHLDHLQQSVDAIALEVERIGEAQRFAQKVLEKNAKPDNVV